MTMLQHKRGVDHLYMVYYKFASRRKQSIKKLLGGEMVKKKFCGKMVKRRYDKDIGKKDMM